MTDDDPFVSTEWLGYADRTISELVPKIRDSAVTVSLVPKGQTDVKFAVELGLSIMLDKPIIAVVLPGAKVPAKMVTVADEIVEGDFDDPTFGARLAEAVHRVIGKRE
jgi:hypothetical protein